MEERDMKRNWMAIGFFTSSMLLAQPGITLPGFPNPVTGIPPTIVPANIKAAAGVVGLEQPVSKNAPALKLQNTLLPALNGGPLVIASIGESYAAGEGNPNVELGRNRAVKWQPLGPLFDSNGQPRSTDDGTGVQCHHSIVNGRAQAALALNALDGVDINFASFACSGSTIGVGLLGSYFGIEPGNRSALPPQIDQLQAWLNTMPITQRRLDVLLISVGGNDMAFGDVVPDCLNPLVLACYQDQTLLDSIANGHTTNDGVVGTNHVRAKYKALETAINALNPKPRFVVITSYPDLVRDSDGIPCDSVDVDHGFTVNAQHQPGTTFGLGGSMKNITGDEANYLSNTLLPALNAKVLQGGEDNGWIFLAGMPEMTNEHGYCAADRWFNTLKDSFDRQGDIFGTAHPNAEGHRAYKHLIVKKLVELLNLPEAPEIEVNQPTILPQPVLPATPGLPPGAAWQVSVEIAPTAWDVDVELQYDVNTPDQQAFFTNTTATLTMQRDPNRHFRQVYTVMIPHSDKFQPFEPWHYRVVIKYGMGSQPKTNFFIGQTYRGTGAPTGI
jgi:hypothetical protein